MDLSHLILEGSWWTKNQGFWLASAQNRGSYDGKSRMYIYIHKDIHSVYNTYCIYIYTYSYINTIETRKHLQIIYTLYTSDKCRHLKHYSTKKWVKKGFSNQDKDVSFTGFGDFPLNPDHGRRSSFNFFVVQTHIRNHDHTRRMPGTENFLREWGNYEKSFLV